VTADAGRVRPLNWETAHVGSGRKGRRGKKQAREALKKAKRGRKPFKPFAGKVKKTDLGAKKKKKSKSRQG